jgi:large subunit ribosomal protein L6
MSRVGKLPVPIPDKTKVQVTGQKLSVTGPKGTLGIEAHSAIGVKVEGNTVVVSRSSDLKKHRALHGLTRALIANMLQGVTQGYNRQLEMIGVGYRAEMKGKTLVMNLGFSHPIVFNPPQGIAITVDPKENKITVDGIDKALVGQTAAKIRSFRKPEPYKGKGVRYVGEVVQHKAGKTAG